MSAQPQWSPLDDETADLLALVADTERVVGSGDVTAFLTACETDQRDHGYVSVSRVASLLADRDIEPHRYSSFWSAMTGRNKPLRKVTADDGIDLWEVREGSTTGNNGKPFRNRIFQGDPR